MTTFSFRAECQPDVEAFQAAMAAAGVVATMKAAGDTSGLTDLEVEMQSDSSLGQLQYVLRQVTDGHVMLQTLREVPLAANSLERDYDLI